jgi:hypothetical protein
MSNLMKIRLVGAELFHVDDQEDRHIDIRKPTVSFRSLANASKVSRVRKYIQKKKKKTHSGRLHCGLEFVNVK